MVSRTSARTGASPQSSHNLAQWAAGKHVSDYANRLLSPAEVQIFVRYREALSGRVLDLGCGAGRTLFYLLMLGAEAHGVDLAPKMVEHCRRTLPGAHVVVGDIAALDECVTGPFDAIIAPDNLFDVFDDAERRRVLAGIRELLGPDGLLIFSGHDLGWVEANPGPREWEHRSRSQQLRKLAELSPAGVARAIVHRRRAARNRARLRPLERRNADHAIINDFPHDYSLLHYYIRRDDQERQLDELGYELIECLDGRGDPVAPGGHAPSDFHMDNLYYVARRR